MYQGAILLDFRGASMEAELQLPVERVQAALGSLDGDQVAAYILQHFTASLPDGRPFRIELTGSPHVATVDGAPYVVAGFGLVAPSGASGDLFVLHSDLLLDRIPAQVILVSTRTDWRTSTSANDPRLLGVLREGERTLRVDRTEGSWWSGFGSVFKLGMRHIAEGTDHLLFLLVLLLPAPLVAVHSRWWSYCDIRHCLSQIAKVVTAFTVGHSITLAAGAANLIHVPSRPIETLIAVSILVSAVHALRPLFPGREAVIAASFGLVHGLAFAATLAELGLGRWERVASILGFNLGIEAMQLVVVAATLPSLILLSRTDLYAPVRVVGAAFAGAVSVGWILERLWEIPNPADAVVMALAQHALWIAIGLTVLGVIAPKLSLEKLSFANLDRR
jgi:hypothetical protein